MVQRPDDDADGPRERAADDAGAPGDRDAAPDLAPNLPPQAVPGVAPRSQREFDERWERIVAELGDTPTPWIGDEDDETSAPSGTAAAGAGGHVVRPAGEPRELSGRDWAGSDQYDEAEEAVDALEHFVPPDPGPVLGTDPLRILTWSLAIGVPLLWVVILVAWHDAPGWLGPVAGVLFLGAVAVLVWRMPHDRDPGSGSGAVV